MNSQERAWYREDLWLPIEPKTWTKPAPVARGVTRKPRAERQWQESCALLLGALLSQQRGLRDRPVYPRALLRMYVAFVCKRKSGPRSGEVFSHPATGNEDHGCWYLRGGDLDRYMNSFGDAAESVLYTNDNQIADLRLVKLGTTSGPEGIFLRWDTL